MILPKRHFKTNLVFQSWWDRLIIQNSFHGLLISFHFFYFFHKRGGVKVIFRSTPTSVMLGWVELWLSWGFDNFVSSHLNWTSWVIQILLLNSIVFNQYTYKQKYDARYPASMMKVPSVCPHNFVWIKNSFQNLVFPQSILNCGPF